MHVAAAILYPQALATSVTLPMEIIQAASQMASVRHRGQSQASFLLAAASKQQMTLASGIILKPTSTLDALPPLDLLLVPAIWRNPAPVLQHSQPWLPVLQAQAARGTVICSVGTGSFLLAEAGLLSGKPATTHWNYFEEFGRRYPDVNLKTRHLITQANNIYCVGSVNSIADLMVHIVEQWFGARIARAIENQFSPEIRRSFAAAAYQDAADSSHHDEDVLRAQQWLQGRLAKPVRIADLAETLHWNTRTLNRRFRAATGMTPLTYLQSLRMNTARDLLRHSNLSIGEIAQQTGLQDPSYFSRIFRRHSGMTPLRYREAVRGKLFEPQVDPP